jgi:Flp pilus assembly protein TadD
MKHYSHWLIAVPALIVTLVYLPALRHELVWSDAIFLRDVPLYRDPALWPEALRRPFVLSTNYFRPLGVLAFMLQLRTGPLSTTFLHLSSVLLHALNTTLVALLARYLCPPDMDPVQRHWLQAGAALLYGLHPALLQGVAFISSQFDLWVTAFLLCALLADVTVRHRVARPLIVAFFFLLAALAKEMAVSFALILPLWHMARRQRSIRPLRALWDDLKHSGDLITYAAVLVAGLLYLSLRYAALGYLLQPNVSETIDAGMPLQRLLLIARSLVRYVTLVIWPFTSLAPIHYSPLPVPVHDVAAWAALIALPILGFGLVRLVQVMPQSGWLIVASVLSLLPVANIWPLQLDGGSFVAERFLLLPLALITLALVPLAHPVAAWIAGLRRIPGQAIALLWLVASVATIQLMLPHWRDEASLWMWGARRAPLSPLPPINLALAYINQGSFERAAAESERALTLDSSAANAWNTMGMALFYLQDHAGAQSAFEEAARLQPEDALYWNNLAAVLREQDKLEEAEKMLLDQVLSLDPDLPVAHLNLSTVYLRADRPDLALQHLQEALRGLPLEEKGKAQALLLQLEDPERWLRLGDMLLASGDPQGAQLAFEQGGQLGAQPADVVAGLSSVWIELDDLTKAEALLQRALEQAPSDPRLHNNLGVVARERGAMDAAEQHFRRANELAPEWDVPRENLASLQNHGKESMPGN